MHSLRRVICLLLAVSPALSQALSGTIVGTITDDSGAAIAGTSITLTNTATGFTRKLLREGIQLTAADTATVNLTLPLGDVKQTLEVTAAAPLL